jgi:hypothetical protein
MVSPSWAQPPATCEKRLQLLDYLVSDGDRLERGGDVMMILTRQ